MVEHSDINEENPTPEELRESDDQKQAEAELAKNKAILHAILESLPFDFFAVGLDGRYLMQNAASKAHWGNLVGNRPEDVCQDPHDLVIWLENNRRAFAGEKVEGEVVLHVHGEERFIYNVLAPIRGEQETYGILGVNIDITARRRAEEALRKAHDELEQRVRRRTAELASTNEELVIFRKFAEASREGFGMSDFNGRILYVNQAVCRMFGEEKPADVIGQCVSKYYLPEYVERRANELIPALLRDGYWQGEPTIVPRDGSDPISSQQSTFLIRDEKGEPFRIAVIISDITRRKRAEEALQRERRTLKHMLQASDHERQLIAYDIHDGLAQQLAGAIMQFQVYDCLKSGNPAEAAKAYNGGLTLLRQAHGETRRLISGVRPPILDESGVIAAVAHLINDNTLANGPKIEFQSKVQFDRLAPVLENVIYRIVQEGLTNACKHSRSPKMRLALLQRGDRVQIDIRDWGAGFESNQVKEGCFGLSGIRQRARLLGGRCSIRSTPGKGTRITVELPLVERDKEE
jgi:PAS domain S-box-containing protein